MRHSAFPWHRYKGILGYTGAIAVIVGLIILTPILCLLFFEKEITFSLGFVFPGSALILFGSILSYVFLPGTRPNITHKDGAIIVVLSWTLAILAGAVPFMVILDFDFTQAVFESTSGWTTTGLSVVDVTVAPRSILFFRSVIQFAGGAGFAIIMLSALAGPKGTALSRAEGRKDQLVPNVRSSARVVGTMYSCYAIIGIFLLGNVGMGWFDAVNHSLTAVSTGGFSTHSLSIGHWDNPGLEVVLIALMLLGATSFVTTYSFIKGRFACLGRNGELRLESALLLAAVPLLFFTATMGLYPTLDKAVRVAIFEAVSAITTTGFTTVAYSNWPDVGWAMLVILMLIGGGTGCTAGGMKQYRVYVLYRALLWEFKRKVLPGSVVTDPDVWHGEDRRFLNNADLCDVGLYAFLYLVLFASGILTMSAYGYSLKEAAFEFASTLSTVGLSVGVTKTTAPPLILWAQIFGMVLGRLEVFTIIVGVAALAKDVPSMIHPAQNSHVS